MPNYQADLDTVFHALADPTRRAVLNQLSRGPQAVSQLAEPFDMALPSFLQHLKVLEESGLVRSEKTGRVRTCAMDAKNLSAAEAWIAEQRAIWEGRLDRLEDYLVELKTKGKNHGRKR
ncbi:MAG: metalloregulator ArsR/SmtB family transcription factor [Pseudomonadota bacterium]